MIVCIGQALIDCITRDPKPHKKNVYRAASISLNPGGDALNEASILARHGADVRLYCGLGKDPAGDLVLSTAQKRGIDTSLVLQSETLTTPIANLMVSADGSRYSYNSPATMLEGFVPDPALIKGARIVSLASLFRAPFDLKEHIIPLVKAAKADGAIICADTKLPTYRDISMADIKEILPLIDYIFPNENEAAYYTGEKDFMDMAKAIQAMGVKNVIVKTGEKGCVVLGDKDSFSLPAADVKAIDTTGAGDNYVAGFMLGILEGQDLMGCAKKGTRLAAECVVKAGAY